MRKAYNSFSWISKGSTSRRVFKILVTSTRVDACVIELLERNVESLFNNHAPIQNGKAVNSCQLKQKIKERNLAYRKFKQSLNVVERGGYIGPCITCVLQLYIHDFVLRKPTSVCLPWS